MFSKITSDIFIGSAHDALFRHPEELKYAGITAILNVAKDLSNNRQLHKQFTMCHIPLTDGEANSKGMCMLAVAALHALIEDGHKVMVHCHEGKSRSTAVVATYLATESEDKTLNQMETEIKEKRGIAQIQPDLKKIFQGLLFE